MEIFVFVEAIVSCSQEAFGLLTNAYEWNISKLFFIME